MFKKTSFIVILLINIALFLIFTISRKFSTPLVIIHTVTLLVLWLYVLKINKLPRILRQHWPDLALIVALFLTALVINLYKVEAVTPGMWGDEVTIAMAGEKVLSSKEFTPFVSVNNGHATPLLYLEGMAIKLFGRTLTAVRIPSLLFGALSIVCFYILLRLFFDKYLSFLTANIMAFSYPHLVISRLAYEITASLFFQILSLIFIYLYYKKGASRYAVGLALSIGAGLYTYVGFRTFAIIALIIFAALTLKQSVQFKTGLLKLFLMASCLFISSAALISFSLNNFDKVMERTKSLSVFGQNLPAAEVLKEIGGASTRLSHIFLSNGDPSARTNPAGVSIFDFVTTIFSLAGALFLAKTNKKFFLISLLLWIPPVINDIFSLERIPEFHYYGLGHPNTLRIAGILPIVFFWTAYGIQLSKNLFAGHKQFTPYIPGLIASIIIIINWNNYFNQTAKNNLFYRYNYEFNGVRMINVADIIKKSNLKEVYLSKSFAMDPRVIYFSGGDTGLKIFDAQGEEEAISVIQSHELTILDPKENPDLSQKLISDWQQNPNLFYLRVNSNPFGEGGSLVFSGTN